MPPPTHPKSVSGEYGLAVQSPNRFGTFWVLDDRDASSQWGYKISLYPNHEVLGIALGGSAMYRRILINDTSKYLGWEVDFSLVSARAAGLFAIRNSFAQIYTMPGLIGVLMPQWGVSLPVGISVWSKRHWGVHLEYNHVLLFAQRWTDEYQMLFLGLSYRL